MAKAAEKIFPTEPAEPVGHGYRVRRRWAPRLAGIGGRRSRQAFEYDAYVPQLIADEDFTITTDVAAAAANAETAVRELNHDPPRLSNLEALARQLLRAESVASSRIEGLILSHRRLAQAAFAPGHDETAESVLGNINALERAIELASEDRDLMIDDLIAVHRELFNGTRDAHLAGLIREEQNWVGGAATSPRDAEFIPPPPEYVRQLLLDLADFINRDDIPAAVQAAIAHVQFESIHPFLDGNGRVGRTIILIVLRRRAVAPRYLPPVSLSLAGRADRYVDGLTSWRFSDDGSDWLTFFADAVWRAAKGARDFADAVAALQQRWLADADSPRSGSAARRLIELLPSNPVFSVPVAAQLLDVSDEAARLAILRLEQSGVLRQVTVGRRNRAWESVGLFDLLDSFERELGPMARTPRPTR